MGTNSDDNAIQHLMADMARMRGEAAAARVLSSLALNWIASRIENPLAAFDILESQASDQLNAWRAPAGGNEELHTLQVETAREQITLSLDALRNFHASR